MFSHSTHAIGVDIADHTIEIVLLRKKGKGATIEKKMNSLLPQGIIVNGRIQEADQLKTVLEQMFNSIGIDIKGKHVIFGLPEAQVFTHAFTVQETGKKQIEVALDHIVSRVIPLDSKDIVYTYTVREKDKETTRVQLVATSRDVITEWKNFFDSLEIVVEGFDIEAFAIFRGIFSTAPKDPICIVDVGAARTNISLFDAHGLLYRQESHIAGDHFTDVLMSVLPLTHTKEKKSTVDKTEKKEKNSPAVDLNQAMLLREQTEKEKKTKGLSQAVKKRTDVLTQEVITLFQTIEEIISYAEAQYHVSITEVVFVGGSSQMKGFLDLAKKSIKTPVRGGTAYILKEKVGIEFLEAIGLAWRGIDKNWDKKDPAFSVELPKQRILVDEKKKKRKVVTLPDQLDNEGNFTPPAEEKKETKKQTLLLIGILIVGSLVIWFAYQFQEQAAQKRSDELAKKIAAEIVDIPKVPTIEEAPFEEVMVSSTVISTSSSSSSSSSLFLYLEPSVSSTIVQSVFSGEVFITEDIDTTSTDWVYGTVRTSTGWISKEYIEEIFVTSTSL